ncbi:MAG: AzlC family ABC transporter permease [Actinobacteria bacterium]|nr:AzlC family ABC transporter permease [Actinomycetota bacterium]
MAKRPSILRSSLALGAAVGVFGMSFGVLAASADVPVPMACAMSLFVFTGATQFAAVSVVASGGSPLSAVVSGLLLGLRHTGYGLALDRTLPRSPRRRLLAAQFLLDESAAMALAQADPEDGRRAFWTAGLAVFGFWNAGTLVGALFGSVLGDPATLGLDAVFPAAFLALLVPLVRTGDGRLAAATGALIGMILVPLLAAGLPIVLAAAGAIPAAVVRRRARRRHHDP